MRVAYTKTIFCLGEGSPNIAILETVQDVSFGSSAERSFWFTAERPSPC